MSVLDLFTTVPLQWKVHCFYRRLIEEKKENNCTLVHCTLVQYKNAAPKRPFGFWKETGKLRGGIRRFDPGLHAQQHEFGDGVDIHFMKDLFAMGFNRPF